MILTGSQCRKSSLGLRASGPTEHEFWYPSLMLGLGFGHGAKTKESQEQGAASKPPMPPQPLAEWDPGCK